MIQRLPWQHKELALKALLGIIGIAIVYLVIVPEEKTAVMAHADTPATAPVPDPNPTKTKASSSDSNCLCGPDCPCNKNAEQVKDHEARLLLLENKARYPAVTSQPVKSGGSTGTNYGSTGFTVKSGGSTGGYSPANYAAAAAAPADVRPRWFNRDGLSRREHLEQVHGTPTTGLTEAQVIAAQNAYHDTYGPGHPTIAPPLPASPVSGPGCPGGYQTANGQWVCPTNTRQERSVLDKTGWVPGKLLSKVLRR